MQQKYKSFLKESLFVVALVLVVSVAVNLYKTWHLTGKPIPEFKQHTINGMPVDFSKISEPTLVHFWASWCPVCSVEHGSIQSISIDYPVISVALNSGNADELRQFMAKRDLDYAVVEDDDGRIARMWSVKGVPSSFILSPDGKIDFVEVGYTSEIGLRARLWWASLN